MNTPYFNQLFQLITTFLLIVLTYIAAIVSVLTKLESTERTELLLLPTSSSTFVFTRIDAIDYIIRWSYFFQNDLQQQ